MEASSLYSNSTRSWLNDAPAKFKSLWGLFSIECVLDIAWPRRIRISIGANRERCSHASCWIESHTGPRGEVNHPFVCCGARTHGCRTVRPAAEEAPPPTVGDKGSRTAARNAPFPRTRSFQHSPSARMTGYQLRMNALLVEIRANLKCACQKKSMQAIGT